MERLEADSIDELYEEIAELKGRCALDKFETSWDRTERYVTFSPIMLVFHEEDISDVRLEQTDAWSKHVAKAAELDAAKKREEEAKLKRQQDHIRQRERAEYERLRKQFGGA